jgi:hypothetical protein
MSDELVKRLFCKCGHRAEAHICVDEKPLYLNPLSLDSKYTTGKCWFCPCSKLDFVDKDDWSILQEQMKKRIGVFYER